MKTIKITTYMINSSAIELMISNAVFNISYALIGSVLCIEIYNTLICLFGYIKMFHENNYKISCMDT